MRPEKIIFVKYSGGVASFETPPVVYLPPDSKIKNYTESMSNEKVKK